MEKQTISLQDSYNLALAKTQAAAKLVEMNRLTIFVCM